MSHGGGGRIENPQNTNPGWTCGDINLGIIGWFLIGTAIFTVLVYLGMSCMMKNYTERQEQRHTPDSPLVLRALEAEQQRERNPLLEPRASLPQQGPWLQAQPQREIQAYKVAQQEAIDEDAMTHAMEAVAAEFGQTPESEPAEAEPAEQETESAETTSVEPASGNELLGGDVERVEEPESAPSTVEADH